ncbi:MAG: hypothetical protein ACR2KT_03845, partial [Methylocella sp.]
ESHAASTRGETREEALTHIHSICFMIVQQIVAQGGTVPADVEITQWNANLNRNLIRNRLFQHPASTHYR